MRVPVGWQSVQLGDVCEVVPGFAFKSKDWQDSGIPVIRIKNIRDDRSVNTTDCACVPSKLLTERLRKYLLYDGDILIAMTGATAGKVGRLRCKERYFLNQRVAKILPVGVEYGYLWPLLSSDEYRQRFFCLADGAAQPNMSGGQIETVEIPLPPLPTQRKTASILSAYDDLIENNLRRIKSLEEMAQNLYREWFVKFRFPGHENARFVDSPLGRIPEGWEVRALGDILKLKYGKALKQADRHAGDVPVFGSSGIVGHHDRNLVSGPGIIVGRKGNVGSVFWSDADFYPIDTAYFVVSQLPLRFLFYDLQTKNFINNDAAVPGLSRRQAYSLETIVPSARMLREFCELAEEFERQASVLRCKSQTLRRTRDLLLPKLIAGELDVSELDIRMEG